MTRASLSELKARLSSWLADIRSGDSVVVCERANPIALLIPLEEEADRVDIREAPEQGVTDGKGHAYVHR